MTADIGISRDEAHPFLREITERDGADNIVGIMGLSLNDHPHRLYVNGVSLSAWCAEDTLFLPSLLQQTATVESYSPLSKQKVRLTVSPERVENVSPTSAVVSMVIVDPTREDMASVEAIWNTFCEHIHFFASQAEAERWAAGRDGIVILSVDDGFELGRQVWARVLLYAEQAQRHLEHLFDAELAYKSDMDVVVPDENREGDLIGSGEGTVTGAKIRGTIRWSMYSADCAYLLVKAGIQPAPGQHLCTTHPGGVIETEDGAQIWFDAKGYGLRGYDKDYPHLWRLTMALQFSTQDERYIWLNTALGVWEGQFDEQAGRARYHAYAQVVK
ncbi:MAG TPA: DUF3237 family protein [Anaerolineae bacterium]|nr:DUF3237 family protein [Anaerolineae bacterium]